MRGDAHALFKRRAGGEALNPVGLNDARADAACFAPGFRGGAGLVGGEEGFAQFRVKGLAVAHVGAEAAAGKNYGALCADVPDFPGTGFAEDIALADANALHAAVGVAKDRFHEASRADGNARGLKLRYSGHDNTLPRALFRNHAARGGVSALAREVLIPFDADNLPRPFKGFRGLFADEADVRRVAESETDALHVGFKSFGRILDALSLLHARTRNGEHAARERRIAADEGHFFKDGGLGARFMRGECGGEPGKARADHDDVVGFIEFGGNGIHAGGFSGRDKCAGGRNKRSALEQAAACDLSHVSLLCFFLSSASGATHEGKASGAFWKGKVYSGFAPYLDYGCKNPLDPGCPSGSTSSRRFPGGLIFLEAW